VFLNWLNVRKYIQITTSKDYFFINYFQQKKDFDETILHNATWC